MAGVFSKLVPSIASAYGLQTLFALIFVPQQNDVFYDFGGACGYLSTAYLSLYYPALKARFWNGSTAALPALSSFAPRQLLLSAALGIWSARLGTYLASRAIKAGGDSRFEEIKKQPQKFTYYWIAQATWIMLVGFPVYLANALPPSAHAPLGIRDYAGLALFASSFVLEVAADMQKHRWRKARDNKQHDERFISSGLWSISRHPNYLGELGIWTGIWTLSTTGFQRTTLLPRWTPALALISPLFTYFLLRYVSGVPPLERQGEKRHGSDPKYQEYKRTVPVFWPWGGYE
ncbi:hypothetical protein HGRIS_010451 [Hohenbuehelia grisea]|uniref:Steroid 5-alpha reductase C-terminal domain-containing protein n=1 Tax=Hohenbuehelia grisea TaxID=104357 RepID=A0ABR3IZK7_9AGAR